MRARVLLFLGATALCAGACSKSPGEGLAGAAISAATGQKVDVDQDGGKVTFQTDKGEMKIASGDDASLPMDFPHDVYLPAGYKVQSAMEMPGAVIVEVDAPGRVPALFADASKQMQARGWKQTMAMQQAGDAQMLGFEKANRSAVVSLYDNDGNGVKVGLQLTTKQ